MKVEASQSNTTGGGQSYFEKHFALLAGHFAPTKTVDDLFPQSIVIRSGPALIRLHTWQIHSIEAAGDYMCFNCEGNKTHVVRKTMKQLESELDPEQFIRIHRSNMVNKKHISRVSTDANGEYVVVLENGQSLKVSRRFKSRVAPQIRAFLYN